MIKFLTQFLSKSFSKLAPNCTITNSMVANVIQTAAMTQDFLENTAQKQGNKPNADIIFERIKGSNTELMKTTFLLILGFMIKQVRNKFNRREWTVAIDTHYEPFYGESTGLWIHRYKPKKGCTGSYKFITVSIVVGNARFTLLALPVRRGEYIEELVEELVREAQKHFRIKLVLLDRGFYSGNVIERLEQLNVQYIVFAPQNKKNKKFLEETQNFSHRYVRHKLPLRKFKTKGKIKIKLLVIKDFIDVTTWVIYDWIFATNLANTTALMYVKLYKQRWGIETSYRMFGKIRIVTTSTDHIVRYFMFIVVVLLYNLWKFYNLIAESSVSFKTFVYYMFLSCVNINHLEFCKEELEKVCGSLDVCEYELYLNLLKRNECMVIDIVNLRELIRIVGLMYYR